MKLVSHTKSKRKASKILKILEILLDIPLILAFGTALVYIATSNLQFRFYNLYFMMIFFCCIYCVRQICRLFTSISWSEKIFIILSCSLLAWFLISYTPNREHVDLGYILFILSWIVVLIIGVMFERKHMKKEAEKVKHNTYRKITKLSKSAKSKQDFQNFITPQQAEKEKKAK